MIYLGYFLIVVEFIAVIIVVIGFFIAVGFSKFGNLYPNESLYF